MERALLRNWAFDELQLGDTASLIRVVGCDANDTFMEIARSTSPFEVKTARETTDLFRAYRRPWHMDRSVDRYRNRHQIARSRHHLSGPRLPLSEAGHTRRCDHGDREGGSKNSRNAYRFSRDHLRQTDWRASARGERNRHRSGKEHRMAGPANEPAHRLSSARATSE